MSILDEELYFIFDPLIVHVVCVLVFYASSLSKNNSTQTFF